MPATSEAAGGFQPPRKPRHEDRSREVAKWRVIGSDPTSKDRYFRTFRKFGSTFGVIAWGEQSRPASAAGSRSEPGTNSFCVAPRNLGTARDSRKRCGGVSIRRSPLWGV